MTTVTVLRSGDIPLRFRGERIATASSETVRGQSRNRWHEISVYRTEGGSYVLQIDYVTRWQGEVDINGVWICDDARQVARRLREHDPMAHVIGYPPGAAYDAKRARLAAQISQDYSALVRDVLGGAGDEFVEEVV